MPTKLDDIYKLEMHVRNSAHADAFCDLLVVDNTKTVFAANIIGQDNKVKTILDLMQEGKTGNIHRAEGNQFEEGHHRHNIYAIDEKKSMYDEEKSKIDDMTQAFIVAKMARPDSKSRSAFLAENRRREENGDEPLEIPLELAELILAWDGDYRQHIYDVLDDRYNTPMLPEWKDHIVDELIDRGYYEPLDVRCYGTDYQLEAGLLRILEEQLEEIITDAIQGMEFEFSIEEDGRLPEEGVLQNLSSIDDYLSVFASPLGQRIQENVGLRFDPDKDRHHPAFHDVNLEANHNGITGLYPPQANTVMGVAKTIAEDDYCFIIGEMGTGKTTMGELIPYMSEAIIQGVDHNPKPKRVIVLSPGIMVEKWAREIKERVPGCETFQIRHYTDIKAIKEKAQYVNEAGKIRYKEPERWEYYIMSSETPKFTYPIEPIRDWRKGIDNIDFYLPENLTEENSRMVRRMVKNAEGNYESQLVRAAKPSGRMRFKSREIMNVETGVPHVYYRPSETAYHCPDCGGKLTYTVKDEEFDAKENYFDKYDKKSDSWKKNQTRENYVCRNEVPTRTLPKERIEEWVFNKTEGRYEPKYTTQKCGHVHWQPAREIRLNMKGIDRSQKRWTKFISGLRKVSPAWYINKQLPRGFFKYLIADEVHEYKDGKSSTGRAFGQLINHTEKQVLLTGTLMGGMSRDIFYLLARLNPKGLLREGISYNNESVFNSRYGISERSSRSLDDGRSRNSTAQKPGISPHLFPMYLMGNCAFLELNDMGYALPPYEEIPVMVDMDPQHMTAYKEFGHEIMSSMRNTEGMGGMAEVSRFMNAMYQYADAPFNVGEVVGYDQEGNRHVLGQPYNFDESEFDPRKFTEMVNIIDSEIYEHGRKNLVYVKYTGEEAWNQMDIYLYEKLKSMGYKVGILRSGGSYDGIKMPKNSTKREEWLHNMMETHDWDILITNPRLVKVGLDMIAFPNIHFFQLDYSTYDYMQASRRSWRLKQTQNVKVFTYVYKDTIQQKALHHIARKIDAAMAMQGKFSEEGLRAMADSGDGMNALAKQLMKDDAFEEMETVHDIFARKNQTFEEMQSVEFVGYEGYVMNPDIETMQAVRDGLLKQVDEQEAKGEITKQQASKARAEVLEAAELFEAIMNTVEDTASYNKGVAKKKQIITGQQELDLFAI